MKNWNIEECNLAVNLLKQAVITKCRDNINAEPSRVFLKKAVDLRAK